MKTKYGLLIILSTLFSFCKAQITGGEIPTVLQTPNPKADTRYADGNVQLMDIRELFKGLDAASKRRGGIVADNFGPGGKVTLSVYLYDNSKPSGKGGLIYQCYSDKESTSDNDFIELSETRRVPNIFNQIIEVDSKDIVQTLAGDNTYKDRCIGPKSHFTPLGIVKMSVMVGSLVALLTCGIIAYFSCGIGVAVCIVLAASALFVLFSGSSISNFGNFTEETQEEYDCSSNYSFLKKVIIEMSVKNARAKKIKVPVLGSIAVSELFLDTKLLKVTVYINDVAQPDLVYPQSSVPTYDIKVGDKVKFVIHTDKKDTPLIEGVPGVWIARFAGEVFYYCSPSVRPGEFKPFLGFDSQVHGVAIRKYPGSWLGTDAKGLSPDGYNIRENDIITLTDNNGFVNTWEWTWPRETDATLESYTPPHTWNKMKTTPVEQRNNQREGLNMELLSCFRNWKVGDLSTFADISNSLVRAKDYIYGFDPDEILYLDAQKPDTENNAPGFGLFTINSEEWKKNLEGDKNPLNLMVYAYRKNRNFERNNHTGYDTDYNGYEIQDLGTSAAHPNGTETGNAKAPGKVKVTVSNGLAVEMKFNAVVPNSSNYKGFYAQIKGTQWPAINEKNVPYTLILPKGISTDEVAKYSLQYDYEDHLGLLKSSMVYPQFSQYSKISTDGKFTARFDMGGWGYHNVTAWYQRCRTCEAVPVAGKELLDVGLRFALLSTANYTDNKDGAYIYLEEYRDAEADSKDTYVRRYGRYLDKYNREYTFTPGQQVTVKLYDSDPHTFALDETEWYLSERTQSKRIPNDSIKAYLTTTLSSLNLSTPGAPEVIGTGKSFTYTCSNTKGKYELKSSYRKTSDVYQLIGIQSYQTTDDGIPLKAGLFSEFSYSSDYLKSILNLMNITLDVDTEPNRWKVLGLRFMLSDYMYKDGPRANTGDHVNRFGRFNDFANKIEWEAYYSVNTTRITSFGNISEVATFLSNYESETGTNTENYISSWYPKNWLRHYSDKNKTFPLDMKVTTSGELAYLKTEAEIKPEISKLFAEKPVEPWQLRLPWIAWTDYGGPRIRTNIKVIIDVQKFFDNTNGAFSGNPNVPADPKVFNDQTELNLMNDTQKDLKKAYYDFKYGRKILVDFNPIFAATRSENSILIKAYNRAGSQGTRTLVYSGYYQLTRSPGGAGGSAGRRSGAFKEELETATFKEELENLQGMTVFPNQVKDILNIKFDHKTTDIEFQIIDLKGAIVDYFKIEGTNELFSIQLKPQLETGLYTLRATTNGGIFLTKFLKVR